MSKMNIGAGIALDGESDFKKAVSGINAGINVLSSEMKKVTSEFIGNESSVKALTAKDEVLNKQLEAQKNKVEEVKKALANAATQYGESDNKTKKWQTTLNNAETDLNKLNNEIKENKTAIEKAQNPTKELAKDVKTFGDHAETAGKKAFTMGDMIKANLISQAIIGGVKALGNAMLSVAREFIDFAKTGVENASNLAESQNVVNVTFGKSASAVDSWSKKAASAYGMSELEAKKYTGTMGAMLKSMGLTDDKVLNMSTSMTGLAGDFASFYNLDSQTAFDKIRSGISGETEPLKQLGINMSVANLEAYALAEGIKTSYSAMSEAEKSTLRYNYLMKVSADSQGDFARTSDGFANQQRIAQLNMENMATSIGSKLLPVLNKGMQTFNGMFDGSISLSDGVKELSNMVLGLADDIVAKIPELAKIGGDILNTVIKGVVDNLPALIDGAKQIIGSVATGITENLPTIIQTGMKIIFDLAKSLIASLPEIVKTGLDIIVQLALGIADALPTLIPTIVSTVMTIVETLIDNVDKLIDAAIAINMALADGLITALPILIDKMPLIIDKLIAALVENLPKLIEMGVLLIVKLTAGIINAVPQLLSKIPGIIWSIGEGFTSLGPKMGEVGLNLIKGIWNGINDATKWLRDKIAGFASGILNSIKDFFGIHSPSSLFRDEIGKNLAMGISEGFSKEMKNVSRMMNSSIPSSFDTDVNVTGGGGVGYATSNIYLDSVLVASGTGKAQYRKTQSMGRTYGVAMT